MLTVHVEPTEDSFSLDLTLRTVNIDYFQGLETYYANYKISACIIVKTLNNLKCLLPTSQPSEDARLARRQRIVPREEWCMRKKFSIGIEKCKCKV